MKLNFDIDKELEGLRANPKPKKGLNFDIDSALKELRTQEKPIQEPEPQPITKTEQTQKVVIPDKWNFELTGNSIEEVNSKVDNIKKVFPEVPIEEINGIRNIRIKGNPELSKKVYSYLNNIPYTQDNIPEFKTPEQEIEGEPINPTNQAFFDLIAPLTTDYSEAQSISKSLGLPETAIDDYNNRVFERSIDERIKTGTEDLKSSISRTAENLLEGIYGSKLGEVKEPGISLAKLGNGIMEMTMLPFTVGLTALSVVPGGEPLGKYAFIEPEMMNLTANMITSKMNIPQEYKDLISNASVIFGLGLKGKIVSDLKGLKNVEEVKPIIDKHAEDIKNLLNRVELVKDEYKAENGIKQDLPQEVIENPITMFDPKKVEDVKEIMLSRNAIQDAINKYDVERKAVEQKLRNKDLTTKELDELDKELSRLDKNVVNWQNRLKETPDPLNIETVSETGTNKRPEEKTETPSNSPADEQKQPVETRTENKGENMPTGTENAQNSEISQPKQPYEMTREEWKDKSEVFGKLEDWNKEKESLIKERDSIVNQTPNAPFNLTEKTKNKRVKVLNGQIKNAESKIKVFEEHKKAIETALSEGKTIPEEVLKDYPELKKSGEQKTEQSPEKTREQLSKFQRHELPDKLDRAMLNTAKDFKNELAGASISTDNAFTTNINDNPNKAYDFGKDTKVFSRGVTFNNYPEWFSQLGRGRKDVIKALEKIIEDNGKDKGILVEKVKRQILDSIQNGRDIEAWITRGGMAKRNLVAKVPPIEEISGFLKEIEGNKITKTQLRKQYKDFLKAENDRFAPEAEKLIGVEKEYYEQIAKEYSNQITSETQAGKKTDYQNNLSALKSNWEKGKSNQTLGAIGNLNRYAEFISDPENLRLLTNIGKYHIERGVKKLSDFTEAVVNDLGEWIRPHAEDLWSRLNQPVVEKQQDYKNIKVPEKKHRIKTGEKESEYQFNENTVNPEIKNEVKDYVKNNISTIKELRRNRISDTQAINKATELAGNLDDGKILSIRRGDTMPIEEHLATIAYTSKRIKEIINDPLSSDIDVSNAMLMWAKTEAIGGELGRSLRARQLVPKFNLDEIKILGERIPEELRGEFKPLLDKAIKDNSPNKLDKLRYWLYNAMLSRPVTHLRNIVGNVSHLTFESALYALTNPLEVGRGLKNGTKTIKSRIQTILNEGGELSKFTEGRQYEPKNKTLRNIMPLKFLELEDVVFKELSKGVEKELQIKSLSKELNENPDIIRKNIEDVLNGKQLNTPEKTERFLKSLDEINEYAKYVTFQNELGDAGKSFTNFINKSKVGFLITPFIRTPVNILKVGLKPLEAIKFTSPEYRAKFNEMSAMEQSHELRRITAGALMLSTVTAMVMNGTIGLTGSGPEDRSKRDLLERLGWRPNSIKIGDKYISYQNLNPFNVLFGMLGNYSDDLKYNQKPKDDELSSLQKISKILGGFAETFTDQSFLSGLSNFFKWINKKDPYYLEQFLQMPVPGFLSIGKDVEKYLGGDDKQYETKGFYDKLMNRLGVTSELKEKLDVFGKPKTGTAESLPVPFDEKEDKLAKLLLEKNVSIGYPKKGIIKPDGTKITDDEYYEYHKKSGQLIEQNLIQNFGKLSSMEPDKLDEYVEDTAQAIRKKIREEMFGKKKN